MQSTYRDRENPKDCNARNACFNTVQRCLFFITLSENCVATPAKNQRTSPSLQPDVFRRIGHIGCPLFCAQFFGEPTTTKNCVPAFGGHILCKSTSQLASHCKNHICWLMGHISKAKAEEYYNRVLDPLHTERFFVSILFRAHFLQMPCLVASTSLFCAKRQSFCENMFKHVCFTCHTDPSNLLIATNPCIDCTGVLLCCKESNTPRTPMEFPRWYICEHNRDRIAVYLVC